jgi:hypothetical protein
VVLRGRLLPTRMSHTRIGKSGRRNAVVGRVPPAEESAAVERCRCRRRLEQDSEQLLQQFFQRHYRK